MAENWWIDDQGRNNLAGIPGDPNNPAILTDQVIVSFLVNIPIAQQDFQRLLPTMSAAEQVRLNALVDANPGTLQPFPFNDQAQDDTFQRLQNVPGVHDPNRRKK